MDENYEVNRQALLAAIDLNTKSDDADLSAKSIVADAKVFAEFLRSYR